MILLLSTAGSVQLTEDIIVGTAFAIPDEYGLGDLMVRRLTRHLGTTAGAMHWHYPSKQTLLGAVAGRILTPCTEFSVTGGRCAGIEAVAKLLYFCLTAHRDGAKVASTALATGIATIRPEQLLADVLGNAPETSISTTSTVDTVSVLVYFILDATIDQQTATALSLNRAKGVFSKGDTSIGDAVDKDVEVETSPEDTAAQAKELGRQRIALGTELFIVGISGAAGPTGAAGRWTPLK